MPLLPPYELRSQVVELVEKSSIKDQTAFIDHLDCTASIAIEAHEQVYRNQPCPQLDLGTLLAACYLHHLSMSYSRLSEPQFSPLSSARLVEQHGVSWGWVTQRKEAFKVAQIIRPQGIQSEFHAMTRSSGEQPYDEIPPGLLIPSTWPEAILTYADHSNHRGTRVHFEEKIGRLKRSMMTNQSPYRIPHVATETYLNHIQTGLERVRRLCGTVERVAVNGKRPDAMSDWPLSPRLPDVEGIVE